MWLRQLSWPHTFHKGSVAALPFSDQGPMSMTRKPRKDERQARILEALRHTPHLRIALLAERFKVTTETIRRDLDALSGRGLVNRARSEEHTSEIQSLMRISHDG